MKKNLFKQYIFTGTLYIPNKQPLEITGQFNHCDYPYECITPFDHVRYSLDGKMNYDGESRNTIQGLLLNNQTFNVPGSEDNPRNFLLFAHFNNTLSNQHYFLAKDCKDGSEFEGQYSGKMDPSEGKVKGIDKRLYTEMIRYADIILAKEESYGVEIKIKRK